MPGLVRGCWASALVAGVVLLTTSCTDQAARQPRDSLNVAARSQAGHQTPGHSPASPTVAGTRAKPIKRLVDSCRQARRITSPFPSPADLVIGPLSYAGLRHVKTGLLEDPNWGQGYFYKSGAQLRPGASATVSIVGPATRYAAIVTESGPDQGSRTVTYRSCADTGPTGYWWVSGFVLWGRRTACVPVKVTSPSPRTEHRAVVSLGAGDCT